MIKRLRKCACATFVVVACALALHFMHIGCPIKFFTGISCPGCGMTRAWLSVLGGNFSDAFFFHPLFWLFPAALVLVVVEDHIPARIVRLLALSMLCALVLVWVMRLADSFAPGNDMMNPVVSIDAPGWISLSKTLENMA